MCQVGAKYKTASITYNQLLSLSCVFFFFIPAAVTFTTAGTAFKFIHRTSLLPAHHSLTEVEEKGRDSQALHLGFWPNPITPSVTLWHCSIAHPHMLTLCSSETESECYAMLCYANPLSLSVWGHETSGNDNCYSLKKGDTFTYCSTESINVLNSILNAINSEEKLKYTWEHTCCFHDSAVSASRDLAAVSSLLDEGFPPLAFCGQSETSGSAAFQVQIFHILFDPSSVGRWWKHWLCFDDSFSQKSDIKNK